MQTPHHSRFEINEHDVLDRILIGAVILAFVTGLLLPFVHDTGQVRSSLTLLPDVASVTNTL